MKSKHEAAEHAKKEEARRNQYAEAMQYCNGDASKAYSASVQRADDGEALRWPLISYLGLHVRLLGKVDNAQPFAHSAVLTVAEEADIVEACKDLNRHGQGIGRKELGELVLESLELRPLVNRGRKYTPLSFNAKQMLESGLVHQSWFVNFFANHTDISERQPCPEEIARAKWMTKENSLKHFDFLGGALTRTSILVDGKIADPRRVLNSDECPNPWGGTGDRGKVLAAVGEPCKKLVSAARQHTSLDACVGLDGYLYDPHLIFSGKHIQRQMVPKGDKMKDSVISVTEKGYQTGATLLATLKHWDRQLIARGVPKPVLWMTDGHASRLSLTVLQWCRDNQWIMLLSPPHTTGIHQPLDQIFKNWHKTFNDTVKRWCDDNTGKEVDKAMFAKLFAQAWPLWTRPDSIVGAFRHCGVSIDGLNPDAIPPAKFVVSTTMSTAQPTSTPAITGPRATLALTDAQAASSSTALVPTTRAMAATTGETSDAAQAEESAMDQLDGEWKSPSPAKHEYNTRAQYWELKASMASKAARSFRAVAVTLRDTPITIAQMHPSFQPKKKEEESEDEKRKGKQTLKGAYGDMSQHTISGKDLIAYLEEEEQEEQRLQDQRDERKNLREAARAEREADEARKKEERELRLTLEQPVSDLLKMLRFIEPNDDEISASALAAFARLNRTQLRALGIEVPAQASKKALMPQLIEKAKSWTDSIDWIAAPPRALPAPQATEPVAAPTVAYVKGLPAAHAPEERDGERDSAEASASQGPAKRTRRVM